MLDLLWGPGGCRLRFCIIIQWFTHMLVYMEFMFKKSYLICDSYLYVSSVHCGLQATVCCSHRGSGMRQQQPKSKINTFDQSGRIILANGMICFVGDPLWLLHGPNMICTVIRCFHNVTTGARSRAGAPFHNHPSLLSAEAGWYVLHHITHIL